MPIHEIHSLGGINELPIIGDNESSQMEGVYSDWGVWKRQLGFEKKYPDNFGKIQGIYEYNKSNGEKNLIVIGNNKVWKRKLSDPPDNNFIQLAIKENTFFSVAGDKIYRHRGYSDEIADFITVSYTPTPNLTGIIIVNGNFVTCDDANDRINIHSGLTETISSFFSSPASNPSGLYWDGSNLWSVDSVTSLIYKHQTVDGLPTGTILESFDSPGIAPTGISCDDVGNLISGNKERHGRFITTKKTTSAFNKEYPQFQIVNDKIYYVWEEGDSTHYQIWTAVMNIDGTGWSATKRTTSAFNKINSQLQVVGDKIYYVWQEYDGAYYQIWTAVMNIDGTGWSATKRTTSAFNKERPQFQIVNDKIYYVWQEYDGANKQVWTAVMNIDGTEWVATKRTTSAFYKEYPQLQVVGDKIYYVWQEYDGANEQVWTAVMNIDGTEWVATKRTTTVHDKCDIQFQIVNDKIYYIGREWDGVKNQIWIAIMNIDGTGWMIIKKTISTESKFSPQLQIVNDKIYCIWYERDATGCFQIWTAVMNIDGTGWSATKRTTSAFNKEYPQFQIVNDKIYYVWEEGDSTHYQIWIATTNLGTIFIHKQKSSLIDRSYETADDIDDIYFDTISKNLISCDKIKKKISVYDGLNGNLVKRSFILLHEPTGMFWIADLDKTTSFEAKICNFVVLNDILIISTGEKWLLKWGGKTDSIISIVPTVDTAEYPWLQHIKIFKNRVIGTSITELSRLKWSEILLPDKFKDGQYVDIEKDDGSVITGIGEFRNELIVFKENSQYQLVYTGEYLTPFTYVKLNNIGAIAHNAIITTDKGLYFMSKEGFRQFGGVESPIISDKIKDTFEKIKARGNLDQTVALDMESLNQIWWAIPREETATLKQALVVYNYLLGTFHLFHMTSDNPFFYFAYVNEEHLGGIYHLYKLNTGNTFDGVFYPCSIRTKPFDFGTALPKRLTKLFFKMQLQSLVANSRLLIRIKVDGIWKDEIKKYIGEVGDIEIITEVPYNVIGKVFEFSFESSEETGKHVFFEIKSFGMEYEIIEGRR